MASSASYIYWRNVRMDANSIPSLLMAEKKSGIHIYPIQGGYNRGGVAASAGTHDGGATVDISVSGLSSAKRTSLVKWLRLCGWAAWLRTPSQGFSYHIHAVRCGDMSASYGARAQVTAYRVGRNGLAGNGYDDGPRVGYTTWENSKYNPANEVKIKPDPKPKGPFKIKRKPGQSAPKGYMRIGDYFYHDISTVDLTYVLREYNKYKAKKKVQVTREVAVVQAWLTASKHTAGPVDGLWGSQTQKAYDSFRRSLGWKGNDIVGAPGLSSLTKLKTKARSGRGVKA